MLGLTAAFLVGTIAYFVGTQHMAAPFRVQTEFTELQKPAVSAPPLPAATPAPGGSKPLPAGIVDINSADAETLAGLPGIGEKRAADIVADRAENGSFRIPEDITRVPGIGEGTLAGLIDYITAGG